MDIAVSTIFKVLRLVAPVQAIALSHKGSLSLLAAPVTLSFCSAKLCLPCRRCDTNTDVFSHSIRI